MDQSNTPPDTSPDISPSSKPSPQPSPVTGAGAVKNGKETTGWLQRLKTLFRSERDTSLRETLEDAIGQHESDAEADTGMPAEARSMMYNLLEFAELRIEDVMVPRADIIAVEQHDTVSQLLTEFIEASHSRLPVYNETLDDPIGMVHIKDLMSWIQDRNNAASANAKSAKATSNAARALTVKARDMTTSVLDSGLVRPLLYVPTSMLAGDLLVKMQSTRLHMAVVVDEYGGTDGLVSIEDLVEEIVGDIADEHDNQDDYLVESRPAGTYLADARAPIEDVEALLKVDLLPDERDEGADTLGGFAFSMLGRVPVRGELIRHTSGIEFEVTEADQRRVKKLKIHTQPQAGNGIEKA